MVAPDLPARTDVTIVGAGIMGTSTAYHLADRTDLDVLLVEKDQVASGSTGDSSAILRHHYGHRAIYSRMAWWSHQFYREFEDHTGQEIAYAEAPMVRFATADNRASVQAGYEILQDLDIPTTRYEADELDAQYPMVETDPFEFAVSDDAAGYSDGTDAASGFARAAQADGATVVTGVSVERILTEGGAVVGVETDTGAVSADAVVVTAGPWTNRLLGPMGVDVPIETTREQVFLLDPPAEFRNTHLDDLPTSGTAQGWYLRPDFGEGVLMATHHTAEVVDPDRYRDRPDQDTVLSLLDDLEDFVPGLAGSGIQGQYCGIYATTPDHDFVIDEAGADDCYFAAGFSGHGFKHGPAVGRLLADLVVKGDSDLVDPSYFSLDRFEADPDGYAGSVERP